MTTERPEPTDSILDAIIDALEAKDMQATKDRAQFVAVFTEMLQGIGDAEARQAYEKGYAAGWNGGLAEARRGLGGAGLADVEA